MGTIGSPATLPLALQISSCPASPPPSSVADNDVIHIQIAEGQWISSSSSRVLVQHSHSTSPNIQCYVCLDLVHHSLHCLMYTCPTCQEATPGHVAHHCLETQYNLCLRWGHSNSVCNLRAVEDVMPRDMWSITVQSISLPNQMLAALTAGHTPMMTTSTPLWMTTEEVRYIKPGARMYEGGNVTIFFLSHVFFLISIVC